MMAVELQASGLDPGQQARLPLGEELMLRLGRNPASGWTVGWDRQISREHADLEWSGERLTVRCLERATNPLLVGGEAARSTVIEIGGEFRIGETVFRLVGEKQSQETPAIRPSGATAPAQLDLRDDANDLSDDLQSFRSEELRQVEFSDPVRQMESWHVCPI
jgi:hypothetical protein